MTTADLIRSPRAPGPPARSTDQTVREMLAETLALIEVVPLAGPPAILLAGPLVLSALMVAGAFACLCTLVVLLVAAVALAGVIVGTLASPYLLVRRVRNHRPHHASSDAHAVPSVSVEWRRVVT